MPHSSERPTIEREPQPQLALLSRWPSALEALREHKVFEALAPELKMPSEMFASPEIQLAIDEHLKNKIESFNSALEDLGMADRRLDDESLKSPFATMLHLTLLVTELIRREQEANAIDQRSEEEKSSEVMAGVAEQYDFRGLDDVVAEAHITGEPEYYREEGGGEAPVEAPTLPGQLRESARKKVLVDMYVQGKALNQLGHMYAYYAGKEKAQSAPYRALADCLHLINAATVLQMASEQSGALAGALNAQMESSAMRLGRVELRKNQEGAYQIHARGMTAAELSHEVSKGLLEYATLDTSLPEAGTLTEEEAVQLKQYLERPAIEMLELVYGAPLAKAVDQSVSQWLRDIRAAHPAQRDEAIAHMAKTLHMKEQDIASGARDRNLSLRLFRVISGLPEDKLQDFYSRTLKKKLPLDYWKNL